MSDETTDATVETVVAENPATGNLEAFKAGEEPVAPPAPNVPPLVRGIPLRFLQLEGEVSGPDTCETTIGLNGLKCNVDLMTKDEISAYDAAEASYKDLSPNDQLRARRDYYDTLFATKLKGFNNMKLQPGQKLRNVAVQAELFMLLLQKSQGGFCTSDFDTPENFSAGS